MAKPAEIQILLPAELTGVYDKTGLFFIRGILMECYMPGTGAMTFFAIHSIDDVCPGKFFVLRGGVIGDLLKPGAMAFEAAGGDRPTEPGSIDITGAVCPVIDGSKVRYGKLK